MVADATLAARRFFAAELEEKMHAFLRGDADVLVSTTIIESGLDIPQANTLVVERADALGLAQLYQIRGRVGRSDVLAHAYLFYPDSRELTGEARARLATLADHTELALPHLAVRDRPCAESSQREHRRAPMTRPRRLTTTIEETRGRSPFVVSADDPLYQDRLERRGLDERAQLIREAMRP
jgi:superfamily II DNA or RNA helicase